MKFLVPILIIIPAIEITLLLTVSLKIGILPTFFLILATGILGAYLAKKQGMKTLHKARQQMNSGQVPGEAIVDGLCILIGGLLLLTPGFFTDTTGFLLLIPATRKFIKPTVMKLFQRLFQNRGRFTIIR
ncbi:membrane protein FxsA [Priestia flexa]|uniref:FxsA family protein n=1 Tax=Priestia flexa TaxID=86664 RepID=UPI00203C9102|nr:FxsA family protein [Priestia flexa]MCM3065052.1 membrane protein FxsA [Priestia flexa]